MSAHGGYLFRPEGLQSVDLVALAREALALDGEDPADASIQVSVLRQPGVLRIAYDAPFVYGRRGARWYRDHHALARVASGRTSGAAHVYAIDPDAFEAVSSYGNGQKVGGEAVVYDDLEMDFGDEDGLDVEAFERMRARWPVGHLGQVFGISRDELLHLPWTESVLLKLGGAPDEQERTKLLALLGARAG